jgi:hypothetical protein
MDASRSRPPRTPGDADPVNSPDKIVTAATLRRRYLKIPGDLSHSARRATLHLAADCPWRDRFIAALGHIRSLAALT